MTGEHLHLGAAACRARTALGSVLLLCVGCDVPGFGGTWTGTNSAGHADLGSGSVLTLASYATGGNEEYRYLPEVLFLRVPLASKYDSPTSGDIDSR